MDMQFGFESSVKVRVSETISWSRDETVMFESSVLEYPKLTAQLFVTSLV